MTSISASRLTRPAILESPFAAPKELRDRKAQLEASLKEMSNCTRQTEFSLGVTIRAIAIAETQNLRYLRALAREAFSRGFVPFASHALYPQWLDDNDAQERETGMNAGFFFARMFDCWNKHTTGSPAFKAVHPEDYEPAVPPEATQVFVGIDLGISSGMEAGLALHREKGRTITEISLGEGWDK